MSFIPWPTLASPSAHISQAYRYNDVQLLNVTELKKTPQDINPGLQLNSKQGKGILTHFVSFSLFSFFQEDSASIPNYKDFTDEELGLPPEEEY